MKVVVTGGSGYLGALVLEKLCADRRVKSIIALDLVPPPLVAHPKLAWKIADVRDPGLDRHFEGANALVHLAFIGLRRASRAEMQAVNVEGSRRMFELARAGGAETIVYSSSIAAYGLDSPSRNPIDENTPRTRTSEIGYFENKFDVEAALDGFERENPKIRLTRFRPAVLFGRRMPRSLSGPTWSGALASVTDARLPIVWDEDVADAIALALTSDARGAFNLAADEQLSARDLLSSVGLRPLALPRAAIRGGVALVSRFNREVDPAWLRALDTEMVISSERARNELGWKPRCPTAADVIKRFVEMVPNRIDPRIGTFLRMIHLLARFRDTSTMAEDARRMKVKVHLEILGPRGGDYIFDIADGRAKIVPGTPRPPDTSVSLSADTLLALLTGADDPTRARLAGRLRLRGEPGGGYVVSGLVTGFRAGLEKGGFEGWSARRLERWFEKARSKIKKDESPPS